MQSTVNNIKIYYVNVLTNALAVDIMCHVADNP